MLSKKTIEQATINVIEWAMDNPLWNSRRLSFVEDMQGDACFSEAEKMLINAGIDNPLELFLESPAADLWRIAMMEDFFTSDFGDDTLGSNVIEEYMNAREEFESAAGRNWLKGLRHSQISLFEVTGIQRGKTFTLRDMILDGTTLTVHDNAQSKFCAIWDCIAARIVRLDNQCYFAHTVLPLERKFANLILQAFENALSEAKCKKAQRENRTLRRDVDELTSARVNQYAELNRTAIFLQMWLIQSTLENQPQSTAFLNSDGETIIACTVRFPMASTQENIIRKLDESAGFKQAGSALRWTWISAGAASERMAKRGQIDLDAEVYPHPDPDSPGEDLSITKLGEITIQDDFLILDTNSEERARRGANYLSERMDNLLGPGSEIQHTNKPIDIHTTEDAARISVQIPKGMKTKEAHQYLDHHYRGILDQPELELGHNTPREAAQSHLWREKAIEWLKQLERSEYHRHQQYRQKLYDTAWIWEELKLQRPSQRGQA